MNSEKKNLTVFLYLMVIGDYLYHCFVRNFSAHQCINPTKITP